MNALNDEIERNGGARADGAFAPTSSSTAPCLGRRMAGRLEIGGVILDLVKPCARCIVTTTDQATGERMGKEPLATLARIRRSRDPRVKGAIFGVNAVPKSTGEIAVGDSVSAS
ncbi:MAG: MOSC domain-containing protein [Parvularculaceae bacterium]